MIISTFWCFWVIVLTLGLFLVWIKLEIITERINEQNQYQRMVNTETAKEIYEVIQQLKLTQKYQEKPESTPPPSMSSFSDFYPQLNSEEILYNELGPFGDLDEFTDDESEESEAELVNQIQVLPLCRTKL